MAKRGLLHYPSAGPGALALGLALGFCNSAVAIPGDEHWYGFGTDSEGSLGHAQVFGTYEGDLIAAGAFPRVPNGTWAGHIARWDGAAWHPVGFGFADWECPSNYCPDYFWAVQEYDGHLYVGGWFPSVCAAAPRVFQPCPEWPPNTACLARWDGERWSSVGLGVDAHPVLCMAVYKGDLYVGGSFRHAGGQPVNYIARWDGSEWHALGEGLDDAVVEMVVWRDELYVGGSFDHAGGLPTPRLAKWNGSSWSAYGGPSFFGGGGHLALHGDSLVTFVGWAGAEAISGVARWDGASWKRYGPQILRTGHFDGFAVYNGKIYMAGELLELSGNRWLNRREKILRFNGTGWEGLGSEVYHQEPWDVRGIDCLFVHGTSLWVGGSFRYAGGKVSWGIARWDDTVVSVSVSDWAVHAFPGQVELAWSLSEATLASVMAVDVEASPDGAEPWVVVTPEALLAARHMVFRHTVAPGASEMSEMWYRLRLLERSGAVSLYGPRRVEIPASVGGRDRLYAPIWVDRNEVVVRYELGSPSADLRVAAYDVRGRLIRELYRGRGEAGIHELAWHPEALPRGVYVLHLATPRTRASQKLVSAR